MKAIVMIMLGLFLAGSLTAQENKTSRQALKLQRKAHRDSVENSDYQLTKNMVDSMSFVLEANYLANQVGYRVPVTSNLNFIKVDSSHVVLQTGRNNGMGYNGVGGVTAEGTISHWSVRRNDKNKSFSISMDVMSNIGIYTVFIDVSSSGRATARLSGLWPGQLVWDGYMVPINASRTYQGSSI
jgi:hypothetical protein